MGLDEIPIFKLKLISLAGLIFYAAQATAQQECSLVENDASRLICYDEYFKSTASVQESFDNYRLLVLDRNWEPESTDVFRSSDFFLPIMNSECELTTYQILDFGQHSFFDLFGTKTNVTQQKMRFSRSVVNLTEIERSSLGSSMDGTDYYIVMNKGNSGEVFSLDLNLDVPTYTQVSANGDETSWREYTDSVISYNLGLVSAGRSFGIKYRSPSYRVDEAKIKGALEALIKACQAQ